MNVVIDGYSGGDVDEQTWVLLIAFALSGGTASKFLHFLRIY